MKSSYLLSALKSSLLLSTLAITACDGDLLVTEQFPLPSDPHVAPAVAERLDLERLITRTVSSYKEDDNLLFNGGFENKLSNWDKCHYDSTVKASKNSADGKFAAQVGKGNCIYQGTQIEPNKQIVLTCDAKIKSKRNDWTALGLSFYDASWNYLYDAKATLIEGSKFNTYTVLADTSANAQYAGAWFYTENRALLDNCTMTIGEPRESENLLENPEFAENIDGWRNACPAGFAEHSNGFNGLLYTGGKSCVHQHLSEEAVAAIRGRNFSYSCTYTSSNDAYASIATNLPNVTTSVSTRLPQTYFGGVPSWKFETVTITGKASEDLTAPLAFVMIGSQAETGLSAINCSLTVEY